MRGRWQDDFSEAHDRHVFRADQDLNAGGGHARPAHPEQLLGFASWSRFVGERGRQKRPIKFAAGFARRDEDGWGHG